MIEHTGTYSPADNKLRLYSYSRLDSETYNKVKAAGFKWAPKQGLFVAPMWTPNREDLLLELCGEIDNEDITPEERATERAERFNNYSEKRAAEAESAYNAVKAITDHIPMGQPILVGHHSERRARKDAKRIEDGMKKTVNLWETSEYWEQRAKDLLRSAKYKEEPGVRARRIKGIEADKRKQEKNIKETRQELNLWLFPTILNRARALFITNYFSSYSACFTLAKYPREPPISQYEGSKSLWSALGDGIITARQARNIAVPAIEKSITWSERWINHYNNRLVYEKTMLSKQGALELIEPKKRPKQLPLINYRAPEGIKAHKIYGRNGETEIYNQVEMTKAEYKKIWPDMRGGMEVDNSHRVRMAIINHYDRVVVFLTDSKVHERPAPIKKQELVVPVNVFNSIIPCVPKEKTKFDDLKKTLKTGIQIISAPQLFPTPPNIVEKMIELADLEPGLCVLEPSAGTGNIIKGILDKVDTEVLAYEINNDLCNILSKSFQPHKLQVRNKDFLEVTDFRGCYERIIMNPPFEKGADIKHINHALTFLKPGGKLVALCAGGPRQKIAFEHIADYWEDLPAGSFMAEGTGVNVSLLRIIN